MMVIKFLFKYFLFRSTHKLKNIETVIQSHGFRIYRFRLISQNNPVTKLIDDLGATEYASHHSAFIATNPIIKGVFIKKGLSDDDQIELLFHEEAHIWYNHPNVTSFTNETDTQQETTANKFLSRIRFAKAAVYFTLLVSVLVGFFFFSPKDAADPIATPIAAASIAPDAPPAQPTAYTEPEEPEPAAEPEQSEAVYITPGGYAYHRSDCYHIANRTNVICISAEQAVDLGRSPCKTCRP